MKKIPKQITLILNETETIFLLDLNSSIVEKDSEEGKAVEEDNQLYDQILATGARTRKTAEIGVQTIQTVMKTRSTNPVIFEYRDNSTFASNWEMYDTYNEAVQAKKGIINEEVEVEEEELSDGEIHKLQDESLPDHLQLSSEDNEFDKLMNNQRYFDAALVIERLLANNCYGEQQKQFKALDENHDGCLNKEVKYNYKLNLLWSFTNEDTKGRCITGISINSYSEEIVAVAYGKYYFMDRKTTGIVMIWNIKNPKQPERQYYFQFSVTSLAFSQINPNLLAVGLYNGHVKVLDISKRDLEIVREDCCTSFEPVWDIIWFQQNQEEYFLACFGDGRICQYKMTSIQLHCVEIMHLAKVEGRLKGLKALRMFEGNDASSSRYAPAVSLTLHPSNPLLYLVGTSEGVIHKCSTNCHNKHIDMFKAHEGTVHTIKFSPFVKKLYATCGDDFHMCIWAEGINEPLIISHLLLEPVLDLDWSPSHSTIMVSLHGSDIFVWDFQRKIYSPQSQTKSPSAARNTICKFTTSGRCLIVGDISGNVHVYSVEGLPFPAFFQQDLFLKSMKRILMTNPILIKKLEKLYSFNFDKSKHH